MRATIAPTDIFHSRKYAQMKSTTRIRKMIRPLIARSRTCDPQLAPTSVGEMSSEALTCIASAIAVVTLSASSLDIASVCTRIAFSPEVVTIGEAASGIPVLATASRIVSTLSWLTWECGSVTAYSTPPSNSMPRLRPLKNSPLAAASTITPEMRYQSQRRP